MGVPELINTNLSLTSHNDCYYRTCAFSMMIIPHDCIVAFFFFYFVELSLCAILIMISISHHCVNNSELTTMKNIIEIVNSFLLKTFLMVFMVICYLGCSVFFYAKFWDICVF